MRFGMDTRIVVLTYLALASWHLGEVERCRLLIEEAVRLATELGHAATLAFAYNYQTIIEARRGDAAAALDAAERLAALTRERGLDYFLAASQSWSTWARARSRGSRANPAELAEDLSDQKRRDSWIVLPFYFGLLGEIEAATGISTAHSPVSVRGWRSRKRLGSATPTSSCIAFAATSC